MSILINKWTGICISEEDQHICSVSIGVDGVFSVCLSLLYVDSLQQLQELLALTEMPSFKQLHRERVWKWVQQESAAKVTTDFLLHRWLVDKNLLFFLTTFRLQGPAFKMVSLMWYERKGFHTLSEVCVEQLLVSMPGLMLWLSPLRKYTCENEV